MEALPAAFGVVLCLVLIASYVLGVRKQPVWITTVCNLASTAPASYVFGAGMSFAAALGCGVMLLEFWRLSQLSDTVVHTALNACSLLFGLLSFVSLIAMAVVSVRVSELRHNQFAGLFTGCGVVYQILMVVLSSMLSLPQSTLVWRAVCAGTNAAFCAAMLPLIQAEANRARLSRSLKAEAAAAAAAASASASVASSKAASRAGSTALAALQSGQSLTQTHAMPIAVPGAAGAAPSSPRSKRRGGGAGTSGSIGASSSGRVPASPTLSRSWGHRNEGVNASLLGDHRDEPVHSLIVGSPSTVRSSQRFNPASSLAVPDLALVMPFCAA